MTNPRNIFLQNFPKASLITLNALIFLCFFLTLFSSDHMRDHLLQYTQNYLKLTTKNFIHEAKSQHINIEDPSQFKMIVLKTPLPNPRELQIFSSQGDFLRNYHFLLPEKDKHPIGTVSIFDKINNVFSALLKKFPYHLKTPPFSEHHMKLSERALSETALTELWLDEDGSYLFTVSYKIRNDPASPILRFVFSDDGLEGLETKVKAIYLKRFSFFFIILIFANWFLLGRIKTQTNFQIQSAFNHPNIKDTAISELNQKWLSFYTGMQQVFFLSKTDHTLFKGERDVFEKPFFEEAQGKPINFAHFIEKLIHEFCLSKKIESDYIQLKISHRDALNVTIDEISFRFLILELLDLLPPEKLNEKLSFSLFKDDGTLSLFIDEPNCCLKDFFERKTEKGTKGQDVYIYLKYLSLWHKGNFEISEITSGESPSLRITLILPLDNASKN
jgi:hypothetical protein